MSSGVEATVVGKLLEWAWAIVGVLMGVIWKRHNEELTEIKASIRKVGESMDSRLDDVERSYVLKDVYEQNRKEVRDVQIKTFDRLDQIGQSLARIEGKLDK